MNSRIKSNRFNKSNNSNNCNSQGDQLIVLSAIISAIILQEVQDDDELNTIGNLFVSVGSNLLLGVAQRVACENNIAKNNTTNNENIPLTPDANFPIRSNGNNSKRTKKVKKRKKLKKVKKIE